MNNGPSLSQCIGLAILGIVSVCAIILVFGAFLIIGAIIGAIVVAFAVAVTCYESIAKWWGDRHRRRAMKLCRRAQGKPV